MLFQDKPIRPRFVYADTARWVDMLAEVTSVSCVDILLGMQVPAIWGAALLVRI